MVQLLKDFLITDAVTQTYFNYNINMFDSLKMVMLVMEDATRHLKGILIYLYT